MKTRVLFSVHIFLTLSLLMGQNPDPSALTLDRIFSGNEFTTKSFGPFEWLDEGAAYTTLEAAADMENARELVRYDTRSGQRTVWVTAKELIPTGSDAPLQISDYDWSADKSKLLIFTNTVKVWRLNTRGDYWVMDLATRALRKVGAGAKPSTLMFAKFSPDGQRVAYVREHDIYVESLATGETRALTANGSETLINGTFDWVYEEEFGLRDGFSWSPEGQHIAFWQLDASDIPVFHMIDNTSELYPQLIPIRYPKVGTKNSVCRVGVVPAGGGEIRWMQVPGDAQENYLPRMEWLANGRELLLQQLNRLQNTRILWRADAATGAVKEIFRDQDEAWVDMRQRFPWYKAQNERLLLSEKDGWQHLYRVSLADGKADLLTPGEHDVLEVEGMDDKNGLIYCIASPENATERYLYSVAPGGKMQRLSPKNQVGTHAYDISPDGKWAVHTFSALDKPPVIQLVSLPDHKPVRMLEDNAAVFEKLAALHLGPLEYSQVAIGNGLQADAWMMKPPGFNPKKKYPIVFYVYSEPASQTVQNRWGGARYLWHRMLTQQGYLVASTDNRGTPAPRGREWRKSIYGKIGIVNVADQAAGARQILALNYVDKTRVGVWGWSGGGSMTLNALFQHPEIYHVGMSVAPVANQRFYDTIYQERYMGLPSGNEEGFTQGSPITHAAKLEGKLLLVHGTGDDNVHYQNAEALANELIRLNKPFDMMSYPNRSHSIREGENTSLHLYALLTRYLTEHLAAGGR